MKVVFWSPVPGQSGTTSNFLATAISLAVNNKLKTLIINGQHNKYSMERALLKSKEFMEQIEGIGIDALFRNQLINNITQETIKNAAISFYNEQLHIIPGTIKQSVLQFKQNFLDLFPSIYNTIGNFYDCVLIDAQSGFNEETQMLFNESDCIVVNLPLYKPAIDEYFNKYHLPNEKVIYLIGRYDRNSRYNIKNLKRVFANMKNKISVIPYNTEFLDAMSDSEIIRYFAKNIIKATDENINFLKEVEKVGNLIDKKRKEVNK